MKSETLQGVIELVAEQTGVSSSRISAATRIREDLGVDGDDASDLLTEFAPDSMLTSLVFCSQGTLAQRQAGFRFALCIVCSQAEAASSLLLSASWRRRQREGFGVMPPRIKGMRMLLDVVAFP